MAVTLGQRRVVITAYRINAGRIPELTRNAARNILLADTADEVDAVETLGHRDGRQCRRHVDAAHGLLHPRRTCPSRIRCQAATGSWTKSRQWETERTLFSSARATYVSAGEGQQRVALQPRVAAYLVVVGQTPGATQRCLNPGFSERIGNSRRTGTRRARPSLQARRPNWLFLSTGVRS